jgi:hypothetical protein
VALDKFVVYAADGTAYAAKGFARPSAEVVCIAIPETHKFSPTMALASADEGAVHLDDGSGVASTLGSRHIGSASANGINAGPYLTSVSMDDAVVHAARGVVVNDDAAQDFQHQKSPARTIKI